MLETQTKSPFKLALYILCVHYHDYSYYQSLPEYLYIIIIDYTSQCLESQCPKFPICLAGFIIIGCPLPTSLKNMILWCQKYTYM